MEYNKEISNDEVEIDLMEVISLLFSKIWIIIISALAGILLFGAVTKFFITPQYQSTTSIYVLSRQNDANLTSSDMTVSTQLTNDYVQLIKTTTVAENVIDDLHLGMTPTQLLSKVTVSPATNARVIYIRVLDPSPEQAQLIANTVREEASVMIQKVMNSEAVNIVDMANLPLTKYSPSLMKNCLIGGLLGAFLTITVILIQHFMNDTIRTAEDVEKYLGMSVLGSIPLLNNETAVKRKRRVRKSRKKN